MIHTGYPILDDLTNGLHRGNLITIVGGPLAGRSMFALNILHNQLNFVKDNKFAFFAAKHSVEEAKMLFMNLAADESEADRMKKEFLFVDVLKCCPYFEKLKKKIIQVVKEHKVDTVIIDSFHFFPFLEDYSYDKLPDISRRLKFLARELGIVIIVTSRTNYQPSLREGPDSHRPLLSDLEQVGDLNYFSDVVLGLMRPEIYNINVDSKGNCLKRIIQVEILKSRKSVAQLISYKIESDKGLIKEIGLCDRIINYM